MGQRPTGAGKRSDWRPRMQPGRVHRRDRDGLNLWLLRDLRYLEDVTSGSAS